MTFITPKTLTIFTKPTCKFCVVAKNLMVQHGYQMHEMNLDAIPALRELVKQAGYKSVPIIFNGSELIGGYEELVDWIATQEGIGIE